MSISSITTRRKLNFLGSGTVAVAVTDQAGDMSADVTIGSPRPAGVVTAAGGVAVLDLTAHDVWEVNLTHLAATEIVLSGLAAGQGFRIILYQDATGGNLATWPVIAWPNHVVPTLSTAPNVFDVVIGYALSPSVIVGWLAAGNCSIPAGFILVQRVTNASTDNSASLTTTIRGVVAGHLLVVSVAANNGTVTVGDGANSYTIDQVSAAPTGLCSVAHAIATAPGDLAMVVGGCQNYAVCVEEWIVVGALTVSGATAANGTTSPADPGAVSATFPALVVGAMEVNAGITATPAPGFTAGASLPSGNRNHGLVTQVLIDVDTGSYDAAFAFTPNTRWRACSVAYTAG
jgi:hypothetical protein